MFIFLLLTLLLSLLLFVFILFVVVVVVTPCFQFGVAVGFLLPPVLVPSLPSLAATGVCLRYMLIGGAAYSTVVLLLVVFGD